MILEGDGPEPAPCPSCGQALALHANVRDAHGHVTRCPCCGGDELYIRKDFPQRFGLAVVVIVGVLSCVLFAWGELLWALGVLLGVVVLDLVIFLMVPWITVCYRCDATVRGVPRHPDHRGFDLATAEKYRGIDMQ